jgi:hypothetical protein
VIVLRRAWDSLFKTETAGTQAGARQQTKAGGGLPRVVAEWVVSDVKHCRTSARLRLQQTEKPDNQFFGFEKRAPCPPGPLMIFKQRDY